MPKVRCSVIIVSYHCRNYTSECLDSLALSLDQSFEVIIVNNDLQDFPMPSSSYRFKVKIINTRQNLGFGCGINLGATRAVGEYLFVLNPDTLTFPDTLKVLLDYFSSHPVVGIVAPLLLDESKNIYPLQGTAELTPIRAIFSLSFINKLFPHNPIANTYWLRHWSKHEPFEVGVVPGTAFLIRKHLFTALGGFDPNYFLYFEESDLCKRAANRGVTIMILPASKLIHYWGKSTSVSPEISRIFRRSRFYYFKKHFGLIPAMLVEFFCRLSLPKLSFR